MLLPAADGDGVVMQTDALFWDSLVFDAIDDVDVEVASAAFGTIEAVARGRAAGGGHVLTVAASRAGSATVTSAG
jgi:hypothetical protein